MASQQPPKGPDADEREKPGDEALNPAGVSTDAPAEGGDDAPGRQPGSPRG